MSAEAEAETLSPQQAATLLGVSKQRVVQLCEDGRLVYTRTPIGRLIDRESVLALVVERAAR